MNDLKITPLLMGPDNPNGWKLEDILAQLQSELLLKTNKIIKDSSRESLTVRANNLTILHHLYNAQLLQIENYATLDAKAPNEGPLGKPRIGGNDK